MPRGHQGCPPPRTAPEDGSISHDQLVVPLDGKEIRIPADPPELLPMLADSGNFGISLVGEPVPAVRLAGASCPGCGENDIAWLQPEDGSETVHCDYCGADFVLPVLPEADIPFSRRAGG